MKRLFDNNERLTDEACKIEQELMASVRPWFKKYVGEGYSIRELAHVARLAIFDEELDALLRQRNGQRGYE